MDNKSNVVSMTNYIITLLKINRLMFSLESINGFLMWHFSNGKDSNIVDTDTFTTNLAGEKYIR